MSNVLVPAVQILQERTNNYSSVLNRDADVLETVRGRWCALLETPMSADKYEYWSRIFNTVVSDEIAGTFGRDYLEGMNFICDNVTNPPSLTSLPLSYIEGVITANFQSAFSPWIFSGCLYI